MTTRDERLVQLKTAVEQWADKEIERLQKEAEFLQSILDNRSTSGQLATSTNESMVALIQTELNEFLSE